MTRPISPTTARLTGIALVVLPLVALALKLASAGWMVVAIIWTAPVWLIGYGLQVAVAASGYLGGRAALREGTGARRALIAAWATSIAVVLVGIFLVDGGDSGDWGSTFMLAAGLAGDGDAADVSSGIFVIAASVWIAGWLWLVVEWVVALVRRRRAARVPAPA